MAQPVYLTIRLKLREVVIKGTVNHAIRFGCAAAQSFEVFEISPMNLGASGDERLGACV